MAETQDLTIQYIGQGIPVLIIHGWTMSGAVEAEDFEPIFTKHAGYRRIYIDLPGMGSSPISPEIKDLDSMLESVTTFIEKQILPSKFLLIGSSCGAYISRALAYRFSSFVDGLLLRVPVIEPVTEKRDLDRPFIPAIADSAVLSSLSHQDRENLGDIPVQTHSYISSLKHKLENIWIPASTASCSEKLDAIRNDPMRYRVTAAMHTEEKRFEKPTLVLTGRQDADVGFRDAWSLVKCYPRATFVAIDRGSHGLPVDEGERVLFGVLVGDWLGRVEEGRRMA